mmetsp:Transcript_12765/g.33063  ORF Transcript_12765/g.33063 Transcript_12765/m.33063 type:complete len:208 (-) Transcript_12765:602-1225(-)
MLREDALLREPQLAAAAAAHEVLAGIRPLGLDRILEILLARPLLRPCLLVHGQGVGGVDLLLCVEAERVGGADRPARADQGPPGADLRVVEDARLPEGLVARAREDLVQPLVPSHRRDAPLEGNSPDKLEAAQVVKSDPPALAGPVAGDARQNKLLVGADRAARRRVVARQVLENLDGLLEAAQVPHLECLVRRPRHQGLSVPRKAQ